MTLDTSLQDGALYYAEHLHWNVMPVHGMFQSKCTCGTVHAEIKEIGKHPATPSGQLDATTHLATIQGWWTQNSNYNVGLSCAASGVFVLDIDPRSGGYDSFDKLEAALGGEFFAGSTTDTVTALTGAYTHHHTTSRGRHLYFRAPEGISFKGKLPGFPGIDIKHNGYVLLPPSNHFSGERYEWIPGKEPWSIPIAEPSEALLALLTKKSARVNAGNGDVWSWVNDVTWKGEKLDLERFMKDGVSEGSRATDIYAITCSMANKYGAKGLDAMTKDMIEKQMIIFNHEKVSPPLEIPELLRHVRRAIEFVEANPQESLSMEKGGFSEELITFANSRGQKHTSAAEPIPMSQPVPANYEDTSGPVDYEDDGDGYEDVAPQVNMTKDRDALEIEMGATVGDRTTTDTGNGRRFVDAYSGMSKYTPGLGWHVWEKDHWTYDHEDLLIKEQLKTLGSIISAEVKSLDDSDAKKARQKWATEAKSSARQKAAKEMAQADPRVRVSVAEWDSNPHLLGVANGVVDLRTAEFITGRPDLYLTKRAPVGYIPGKTDRRFQEFLNYATEGDKEYQEWLQRAFGYTLTGRRDWDVFFIMYGPGGSGKNVMTEGIVKCLGTKQYAFPLDSQILAQDDGRSNQTDLYHWAELRGRRMYWVDELPESERIKENAIKKLTGSSEISARSPGEKPFTFQSQGKLWVTTNHRPIITDEAMWRRIRPVPWSRPPVTPDNTLKSYLHDTEGGLPAMLAWAVEGAMKLYQSKEADPLGWCSVVKEAAAIYQKNEDRMGLFLQDEATARPDGQVPLRDLFQAYRTWSEDRSEKPMSQIAFQRKITDRGIHIAGEGKSAVVIGYNRKLTDGTGSTYPASYASPPGQTNWGGLIPGS